MLLDAIVIILRETIEAGVLISVLLSMANRQHVKTRWLWLGLALGIIGSIIYMKNIEIMSAWFEYVGQEIINAFMQYLIFFALFFLITFFQFSRSEKAWSLHWLMTVIVTLALIREGAEVLMFYSGFWITESGVVNPLTSGFVGLMIGASLGAIFYYLLMLLPERIAVFTQRLLLVLIAAGMVAQATQLLIQADWLPTATPLWNTTSWLPEQSVLGTLAYAVLGYEATPSGLQVGFYGGALAIMLMGVFINHFLCGKQVLAIRNMSS